MRPYRVFSLEMDWYDEIYWDIWDDGWRGSDLRRMVASVYRSKYGN